MWPGLKEWCFDHTQHNCWSHICQGLRRSKPPAVTMQAPAADHKGSQKALLDTFSLSNISPQVGKGFNR